MAGAEARTHGKLAQASRKSTELEFDDAESPK